MRKENQNVNICSRKGITLVELVVSMTLVALFSVVCVSLINPIERIYQHTVKLSHAQLIVDTVVDSIRKECTDVDNSDEGSVWIAKGSVNGTDSVLYSGPVSGVYVDPDNSGSVLVMRKNGNYCEAIFSCFKITEDNLLAVEKTGMTGTSFSHAASSLSDEKNKANLNSGYVHFGYYQAIDNSKGVTPDKDRIYDYTNPITASTYEGYTVSLSFENLQYKEDENHVKHPTFVECSVNVYDGDYTKPESKRIYTRKTVISFSPNGSGKGTNAGSGGGTSATKKGTVTVRWVDSDGKAIAWPSTIPSVDVTLMVNGTPVLTKPVTNNPPKFGYSLNVSGELSVSATNLEGYTYKATGKTNGGFIVTYMREDNTVKLINGEQFYNKIGKDTVTGIVFGKKSEWIPKINEFKSQGAKVEGPTNVAVPYGDPYNSTNTKNDYVLYKVTMSGVLTDYVLSENGKFVLNESCKKMFYNCKMLKTITGFTGPAFSSVFKNTLTTDMSSMFEGCAEIENFRLAGLVSSTVTNTNAMFKNCTGVRSYSFSDWNTSGITNMSYMFNNFQMTNADFTIDISNFSFNQLNDIDMSHMFDACGAATIVFPDMSNAQKTNKINNINYMFNNCKNLTAITRFLVNKETAEDSALSSAPHVYLNGVTKLNHLFDGCTQFKNIRLWISLAGCTRVEYMISNCVNLKTADLSGSDFSSLTQMIFLIYNCEALTTVKINEHASFSSFTGQPTEGKLPSFEKCNSLVHLEMKDADLSSVIIADFIGRRSLTYLDLSGAVMTSYTNVKNIFKYTNKDFSLQYVNFTGTQFGQYDSAQQMFSYCKKIQKVTGFKFPSNSKEVFKSCNATTKITLENCNASDVTDMSGMFNGCTALTSVDMSGFTAPNLKNCQSLFEGCSNLDIAADIFTNWGATGITNLSYIFKNCTKMGSGSGGVTLSGLGLGSCETMQGAFYGCTGLTSFTFSNVTMNSCTNISQLLSGCSELTTVHMSGLTAPNLTNCQNLFENCYKLDIGEDNLKEWEMPKVTNLSNLFKNCQMMGSSSNGVVSLSYMNFSSCTTMENAFNGCTSMKTLKLDHIDFAKCNSFTGLYSNCPEFTSIEMTNSNLIGITTLKFLFEAKNIDLSGSTLSFSKLESTFSGKNIESFILNGTRFPNCTSFKQMFTGCKKLKKVEMVGLYTPELINCSQMFEFCYSLNIAKGKTSGWYAPKVENLYRMFYYACYQGDSNFAGSSSAVIDISGLSFNKVKSFEEMFWNNKDNYNPDLDVLTTIYLPSGDNAVVNVAEVNTKRMFNCREHLTNIDNLKYFGVGANTKITNASSTFARTGLTIMDISGFDLNKVTGSADWIFNQNKNLTTIYVHPGLAENNIFATKTSNNAIFDECSENLVGQNGTKWKDAGIKFSAAKVDQPGSPGYFSIAPTT